MSSAPPGLTRLNEAARPALAALLREVCGSAAWGAAVLAGLPYARPADLLAASDAAVAALTAADLDEALAGHPPIGRPAPGDPVSAREQRGVGDTDRAQLLRWNLAYQAVHGHVFLICAAGRAGSEMLAALKERTGNDGDTEREIVRAELGKINRLRLTGLVTGPVGAGAEEGRPRQEREPQRGRTPATVPGAPRWTRPGGPVMTSVSTHILDTSAGRPAGGVTVELSVRPAPDAPWIALGASRTEADGRCADLPGLPPATTHARLRFEVEPYLAGRLPPPGDGGAFFPEVDVVFAVAPGEHYHVPLLLSPFGYSVYRGS